MVCVVLVGVTDGVISALHATTIGYTSCDEAMSSYLLLSTDWEDRLKRSRKQRQNREWRR